MIYLASPYSHPAQVVREWRFMMASMAAAKLIKDGEIVYSPIAHSHPIAVYGEVDQLSHDIWLAQDVWYLEHCDEMVVLRLPGWEASKGVAFEIDFVRKANKPIEFMSSWEVQHVDVYA